jgi:hypothetical protein
MGAVRAWWLSQSSKLVRPDLVGLGGFDSHTLPPLSIVGALMRFAVVVLTLTTPIVANAQRADSAAVAATPARTPAITRPKESITGPPISPRRAFLYSLLVPGLGQSKLDRPHAGALYVAVEAVSLAMAQKSARSVVASRTAPDSIIVGYTIPSTAGADPVPIYELSQLRLREKSRKTQVEDWVAVLIFNHFFSGADAFVAAQLWDLPAVISAKPITRGAALSARVSW